MCQKKYSNEVTTSYILYIICQCLCFANWNFLKFTSRIAVTLPASDCPAAFLQLLGVKMKFDRSAFPLFPGDVLSQSLDGVLWEPLIGIHTLMSWGEAALWMKQVIAVTQGESQPTPAWSHAKPLGSTMLSALMNVLSPSVSRLLPLFDTLPSLSLFSGPDECRLNQ